MKIKLEFLWTQDVQLQDQAEEILFSLLPGIDHDTELLEWDPSDKQLPHHLKGHKGPALFVNKRKVTSFLQANKDDALVSSEIESLALREEGWNPKSFLYAVKDLLIALAIGLFPKCPFCWASYMAVFASWGLPTIPYKPWILIVLVVLLVINLTILVRSAILKRTFLPLAFNISGAIGVVLGLRVLDSSLLTYTGLSLILISAMLNANVLGRKRKRVFRLA